jgi:hypothetical protein
MGGFGMGTKNTWEGPRRRGVFAPMKIAFLAPALVAAALTTVACGKTPKTDSTTTTAATTDTKAAGGIKGSCNLRKDTGTCSQETDKSDDMGLAKGLCEALKGTWSTGPCPQDDKVLGTCADKDGSTTFYYSDGDAPRDLDDAQVSCEKISEGKFTAIAKPKTAVAAAPAAAPKNAPKPAAAKPGAKKK